MKFYINAPLCKIADLQNMFDIIFLLQESSCNYIALPVTPLVIPDSNDLNQVNQAFLFMYTLFSGVDTSVYCTLKTFIRTVKLGEASVSRH